MCASMTATIRYERVSARVIKMWINERPVSDFDVIEDYLKKHYVVTDEDVVRAEKVLEESYKPC